MNAEKPQWINAEKTAIKVTALHPVFGPIPFTASQTDPEAHGREIFARAAAGDFGPVADFTEKKPNVQEIRRNEITARLTEIDQESIRPARAVAAALAEGQPVSAFDAAKLNNIETEAATLRAELAAMK